jgi:TolA-binding protein
MLYRKGDAKGAVVELKEYITKFPNSEMLPAAMLTLGQAQRDSGQRDAARATLKDLTEKFPKSEVAPYAYFQMAAMLDSDAKYAELRAVMKDFASKYPEHADTYKAYNYIAEIQSIREKKFQDAIATYEEFVEKFPSAPRRRDGDLEDQRPLEKEPNPWASSSRSRSISATSGGTL